VGAGPEPYTLFVRMLCFGGSSYPHHRVSVLSTAGATALLIQSATALPDRAECTDRRHISILVDTRCQGRFWRPIYWCLLSLLSGTKSRGTSGTSRPCYEAERYYIGNFPGLSSSSLYSLYLINAVPDAAVHGVFSTRHVHKTITKETRPNPNPPRKHLKQAACCPERRMCSSRTSFASPSRPWPRRSQLVIPRCPGARRGGPCRAR